MKSKTKQKFQAFLGVLVIAFYLLLPFKIWAATLSARPLSTQVNAGATFTLSIDLNPQGKTINNAEAVVSFPPDLVEAMAINYGGSIFTLWVEQPSFSNSAGTVTFNGGVPNPGYSGSGGHVLSVSFKAKAAGTAQFTVSSAAIRENDGLGTNVLTGQSGGVITISEQTTPTPTPVTETPISPEVNQASGLTITSITHPDPLLWYNKPNATFYWKLPAGALATQTSLDKTGGTTPRVLRKPAVSTLSVENTSDGIWYFNARVQTRNGWSKVFSYKIQIDTAVPENLSVKAGSNGPVLSGSDALSGLDYYLVEVDKAPAVKVLATGAETLLNLPSVSAGMHEVKVTAYDKAGNFAVTTAQAEFKQLLNVAVSEFPKTVYEGDRINLKGLGPKNSKIVIQLLPEGGPQRSYTVASLESGEFSLQTEPISGVGNYKIWAQAQLPDGSLGISSPQVQTTVLPSAVTKAGAVFKFLSSLLTVSNVIILLLTILCILGWTNYFILKKSLKPKSRKKAPPAI